MFWLLNVLLLESACSNILPTLEDRASFKITYLYVCIYMYSFHFLNCIEWLLLNFILKRFIFHERKKWRYTNLACSGSHSNGLNSWGWPRLKRGFWNSIHVSHMAEVQGLGPFGPFFLLHMSRVLDKKYISEGRSQYSDKGSWCHRQCLIHCTTTLIFMIILE